MPRYEFKVIPAPRKGDKQPGLKTVEDRFAAALTALMNQMGRDGWDYVRADTLPVDERSGLTGVKTSFQNMLVFRRLLDEAATETLASAAAAAARPRLGPAEVPAAGSAPALGPASPGLAAE